MLKYLLLLVSFSSLAEVSIEVAQNHTQMEWKGASAAKYDYRLRTIGLVWFNDNTDNNFGARLAYGKARATLPQNGAVIPHLVIELKHSIDLELLYRHSLYGGTFAYYGLGYYADNLPISSTISDYYKDDWDNGIGFMAGLEHKMTDNLSIQANIRHRNSIGPAKTHNGALGSSHRSIGISARYKF